MPFCTNVCVKSAPPQLHVHMHCIGHVVWIHTQFQYSEWDRCKAYMYSTCIPVYSEALDYNTVVYLRKFDITWNLDTSTYSTTEKRLNFAGLFLNIFDYYKKNPIFMKIHNFAMEYLFNYNKMSNYKKQTNSIVNGRINKILRFNTPHSSHYARPCHK